MAKESKNNGSKKLNKDTFGGTRRNIISLSRHEQECLGGLCFERYFFHNRAT